MKSAWVVDRNTVEIRDIAMPEIGPKEVLVKVRCAGVCGSDLHLYNGTHFFRKWPTILGHEVAGDVAAIGAEVTRFKVGDKVTVNAVETCGKCLPCRLGHTGICSAKRVPGTPGWIGTFAEYFPAPEALTYKLADEVEYHAGVVIEPMTVAEHVLQRVLVEPRETLAILGCGSIGLLVMFLARRRGYKKIICSDPAPGSRELAMKLGADAALDPLSPDFAKQALDMTGGDGVDAAVIAAGAANILDQASGITRKGGDVVLVSMITKTIPVNSYSYVFKEQRLIGSMVYDVRDFDESVRIANSGADLKQFVTHRFPLDRTQEAMEVLRRKDEGVIKVVVDVS